jgi:NADH:ubiquinone oxidoreductase subunit 6 (subunit J)
MKTEPAAIAGAVTTFVLAVCALLVAFGIDVSKEKQDAIIGCIIAAVPLLWIIVIFIRQSVFSPETTQNLVNNAKEAGETNSPPPVVQP